MQQEFTEVNLRENGFGPAFHVQAEICHGNQAQRDHKRDKHEPDGGGHPHITLVEIAKQGGKG